MMHLQLTLKLTQQLLISEKLHSANSRSWFTDLELIEINMRAFENLEARATARIANVEAFF